MAILDKINIIDNEVSKMKKKLAIPQSSSLAEVTNSIGKTNLQTKSVTPATYTVSVEADEGYNGLYKVNVNPIKAAYISDLKPEIIKKGEKVLEMTGTYGPSSQVKTITPTTYLQEIEPDENFEFMSKVYVNPVSRSIDDDIRPENIKKGVEILEVTGTFEGDFRFEEKTVSANKEYAVTVEPSVGIDGLSKVTVNRVTSAVDNNIQPENIKKDIKILDTVGTYEPAPSMSNKVITPTVNTREYYPDEGYDSFKKVTVQAISPALDSDLKSENIRENVDIFGVRGTLTPLRSTDITIEPSTEPQTFSLKPNDEVNGYANITVNPVTASIDPNILPGMIKINQEILGVRGTYAGDNVNIQENKSVTPGDEAVSVTPDMGYDALGTVTVEPVPTQDVVVNASYTDVVVTKPSGAYIKKVTVPAVNSSVDSNIQPENIKQNIEILGVVGTYTGKPQDSFKAIPAGTNESNPGVYKAIINLPDGCSFESSNAAFTFSKLPLVKIPNIDFSNVTNLNYAFYMCTSIVDVSNLRNLNNVQTMENALYYITAPNSVLNLDVPNATNLRRCCAFTQFKEMHLKISSKCKYLASFCDHCGTSTVTIDSDEITTPEMSYFMHRPKSNLTTLIISDNVRPTNLEYFLYCYGSNAPEEYTAIDFSINASECTNCRYMFEGNHKLKSVEFRGESRKVTNFGRAFSTGINGQWGIITALHTVKNLYFDSCINLEYIFGTSKNLTTIEGFYNLGMAYRATTEYYWDYQLDLRNQTKLTYESLMNVINGLYDLNISYKVAEGGTLYRQKVIMSSASIAKLTNDEIAIATNKGWDITTS